jgi:hypothetical protein
MPRCGKSELSSFRQDTDFREENHEANQRPAMKRDGCYAPVRKYPSRTKQIDKVAGKKTFAKT